LMEVHQSPGRKFLQLSRSLDSFLRAALPFMTSLPCCRLILEPCEAMPAIGFAVKFQITKRNWVMS
jgi:hypothetical protein